MDDTSALQEQVDALRTLADAMTADLGAIIAVFEQLGDAIEEANTISRAGGSPELSGVRALVGHGLVLANGIAAVVLPQPPQEAPPVDEPPTGTGHFTAEVQVVYPPDSTS
ncbi:hypothetical protein GS502_11475 [Rhodococcus hoagii]|nr:hypothetical protein [Prescottella equi]